MNYHYKPVTLKREKFLKSRKAKKCSELVDKYSTTSTSPHQDWCFFNRSSFKIITSNNNKKKWTCCIWLKENLMNEISTQNDMILSLMFRSSLFTLRQTRRYDHLTDRRVEITILSADRNILARSFHMLREEISSFMFIPISKPRLSSKMANSLQGGLWLEIQRKRHYQVSLWEDASLKNSMDQVLEID